MQHVDVLIVGAGLSGIGAAYYLQTMCPTKSYAILEGRDAIGGTWDLFRYPGVRSDSDMYTLGYRFRPWTNAQAIADGPSILQYVRDTAMDFGIDSKIRFKSRVRRASWSTMDSRWTVDVETGDDGHIEQVTCNFVYLCTGYYDYDNGYTPEWDGMSSFSGRIIHPQKWPQGLDYAGKRVVVIGSGATAVTLVPAMAETAAHVTMLQRSPTYVLNMPRQDRIANWLRKKLPANAAYGVTRWKNIIIGLTLYHVARRRPEFFKRMVMKGVRHRLGPDHDVKHFTPTYNPWDQRLCLVPDADLFNSLRSGTSSVVTDDIARFTESGIELKSGRNIDADIIVTATGLNVRLMHGLQLVVDDKPVELSKTMAYKGMMYSDVPNLVSAFGYTNASWTLKCDLTGEYVCKLLNYMDAHGYAEATPRRTDPEIIEQPVLDFSSGYVQRALPDLPKQGSKKPWRLNQNYALDLMSVRLSSIEDDTLQFKRPFASR